MTTKAHLYKYFYGMHPSQVIHLYLNMLYTKLDYALDKLSGSQLPQNTKVERFMFDLFDLSFRLCIFIRTLLEVLLDKHT